ncbi:MAG: glycosyltransferase family 39 protein [Alphaproteobacteria bacterium]|nr:glycosyltransferase family 39 protein [Alphaproteobacteria bacterium]
MLEKLTTIPGNFFGTDGRRLTPLAYLFLLMLCVAFFTPGLVTMPPTDRDESSFAQASKQMVESGDYTDIRVQSVPRYKKPIGIYWLQSASAKFFDPQHLNEIWAYRLPSFAGATLAVLMTAALGSLLFTPTVGLTAAMMLAGCILLNVEARLATTDAALLGSIMVAMYGLARAYKGIAGWGTFFLFWSAVAAGILLKGPIIVLPIVSALLWLRFSDKKVRWAKNLRPLRGLIYTLALVAPWFVAIMLHSHGAFMQASAGDDMLAKIWQGQNRGVMPPGMHLLALPITFFPFSIFIFFAAPDIWKNRRHPAIKFCLGWLIPVWILFELPLTKLPHYVLPLFPALALLTAKAMNDGFASIGTAARRWPVALGVALWLLLGFAIAATFALAPAFSDHLWMPVQIGAGAVLLVTQAASLLLLPRQKTGSLAALTAGMLVFLTATFGTTLPGLQHAWMTRQIVQTVDAVKPCADVQIVAAGYHEPSLIFMGGTDTLLAGSGAEAAWDMQRDNCRVAVIGKNEQQDFLNAFTGTPYMPQPARLLEGLNSGHGGAALLTVYRVTMAQKPAAP